MPKRSRQNSSYNRDKEDDALSQLPDEILIEIISRLSLGEAVRTSVLSTRWKYLWTFTNNLNFDAPKKLWKYGIKKSTRSEYINWVNRILKLHKGSNINEFKIRYELCGRTYRRTITNWIHTAMDKHVQKLELNLTGVWSYQRYKFPREYYNSLSSLRGLCFTKSLKSLSLVDVDVTGEILDYFIYNCPLLERLHVENTESPDLLALKVVGSSIRLKYLEFRCCFSIKEVEISAPSLLSFKFFGSDIKLKVDNVPHLHDVSIGGQRTARLKNLVEPIMNYLPQLETLELYLHLIIKLDREDFPMDEKDLPFCELPKLKHLIFTVTTPDGQNLLALTRMIEACPSLQKFTLKLKAVSDDRIRRIPKFPKRAHQHLKVVELIGFVGRPIDLELAFYLLENAVVLEKMIINPTGLYELRGYWEFEDSTEKEGARIRARQYLEEKIPQGVEFIIL